MINYFQKIKHGPRESVLKSLKQDLDTNSKRILVTANSETFVFSDTNKLMQEVLKRDETEIVVDGIAAYQGLKYLGVNDISKVPGVEIVHELLNHCNKNSLNVVVFGGKQESIDYFTDYAAREIPNANIVGISNGYVKNRSDLLKSFETYKPDLILVAMGIPLQEILINEVFDDFSKGVFIGCGGSVDVIGGYKKRAPNFVIKTNTEWAYRIIKEPKRFFRFVKSNVLFLKLVIRNKKQL